MEKEYELIPHPQIQSLQVLLVRLTARGAHAHKELELGLVLEGEGELIRSGAVSRLIAGDMYVLNPMELHEMRSAQGMLILAIQLSQRLVNSFFPNRSSTYFVENCIRPFFTGHETRYALLKGLMVELSYHYYSQLPNYEYKCMSLLNMIVYSIHSYVPKHSGTEAELLEYQRSRSRLTRITEYIEKNFQRKLLLQEIAEKEGLSLHYLSHFFREHTGMSFREYLNRKRLDYACGLLRSTNKGLLTVSIESGFSDVRYLNALCQRYYHCSAPELRRSGGVERDARDVAPVTQQRIYTAQESILTLSPLREACRAVTGEYTIWDFFR